MAAAGTWDWACGSNGRRGVLRRRDQWALAVRGGPALASHYWFKYGRFFFVRPRGLPVEGNLLDEIASSCPDLAGSGLCKTAYEECKRLSDSIHPGFGRSDGSAEPWLLDHCLRTFGFGVMRALKLGVWNDVNRDLLFVAAMLHDIELVGDRHEPDDIPCFAVRGALFAYDRATEHGWPKEDAATLREAICIHLNPGVSRSRGLEAHLLAYGTALDVAGLGFYGMPEDARDAVVGWKPRPRGLRGQMWTQWSAEAAHAPQCRAQFLNRPLGLKGLGVERRIYEAPFADDA